MSVPHPCPMSVPHPCPMSVRISRCVMRTSQILIVLSTLPVAMMQSLYLHQSARMGVEQRVGAECGVHACGSCATV
eukprot:263705-Chlamydomonas_euryale.AAC.1